MAGTAVPQHNLKPASLPLFPKRIDVPRLGTATEASQRQPWTGHPREALTPAPGATQQPGGKAGCDFCSSCALAEEKHPF